MNARSKLLSGILIVLCIAGCVLTTINKTQQSHMLNLCTTAIFVVIAIIALWFLKNPN